jgi:tRNA threonylcarbamoyladenosine biosynthesis protein TsaB
VSAVLGFDTATQDTAVAVTREGALAAESARGPDSRSGRPAHATALLVDVEKAVAAAGGWEAIERIAVGVGPGSFTGLRVGVAAARAFAGARGLEVAGVGTLEAIAAGLRETAPDRPALAVLDARRGEAFAGLFEASGAEVWPPFLTSPAVLAERLAEASVAPLAAGDGSLRFRHELEDAGALVADDGDPVHRVSGRWVCRLGETAAPTPLERLNPIYLRRPDAETWRERQRSGGGG